MKWILVAALFMLSACGGDGSSQSTSQPLPQSAAPTPVVQRTGPIVFIGDSITLLWPLDRYLPNAVNVGVSGDETTQMLARFDVDVIARSPAAVVILGGICDIKNRSIADAGSIYLMAQKAEAANIPVIVGTVMAASRAPYPELDYQLTIQLDSQIKAGAAAYGYGVADFHAVMSDADGVHPNESLLVDGLHPSQAGYDAMWNILRPMLTHQ